MVDHARLKQWLAKYQNPDAAYRDLSTAMNHYKSLVPQQESYIFTDGSSKVLVNLIGTIPVNFKGVTYNIPICIWLMDTHPNNAPICYVKPTSDMNLKVSRFVDQNGKIFLPYLHDWVSSNSDLLGLIHVMIVTFGEKPPVYAKPKQSVYTYPTNPVMPVPPGYGGIGGPANLPYPPATPYSGQGNIPFYPPSNSGTGFPGYPPYPPASNFGVPMPSAGTGTIKDEHIKVSLISAIEEKLLRKMKEEVLQKQAELQTLKRTQDELKQGKIKLDAMLNKLEKEQKDLDKHLLMLKDKEQELNTACEKMENQESMDIDDAVTTTAPLYKQLLNAYAEEAALEDAIYYMGEALRCGVIDLDVFLKQVRTLSRKQFMLRGLMQKCRQKAGLAI
ncbi:tumor susceptibility gene 101 [Rhynchophorus ferrugineus]|uniref:Tumor susceptibility gene 101 protein n=1 Tax=Rhynchophorus ferrugineus TaxID=354439 RepID=A0A834HSA7_RHYFE|nr:hypothetical protein GWI33_020507 [Rhynchophorus ferrugineus]